MADERYGRGKEEAPGKLSAWEKYMEQSVLRQSLLNWYEFDGESSLLEIHAGAGALTGLFCERCKTVTALVSDEEEAERLSQRYAERKNLRIRIGDPMELFQAAGERFDYIVSVGGLEYAKEPVEALKGWLGLLKREGILLMAVENRYGLKYFCGAKDPHTHLSFDGVNGYLHGANGRGRCLDGRELEAILAQAGALQYKLYYPVPDSRMPQMIFTDAYQEGLNAAERLADYNYGDSALLGVEHRIFCDMIHQGALHFLANSFLVETTKEGRLSDIIYAVPTTDRGKERGMATTIRDSGIVVKRPLWPEGSAHIQKLHANTEELAACGVPVVRMELERDSHGLFLRMPYREEKGLSYAMSYLAEKEPEKFVEIFDRIYGYILAASGMFGDLEGKPARSMAEDLRLEKAYLDLAPCNCFYDEAADSLLFYDQEFVMEDCPAQFAIFRTLKYCYASAREMESYVPLRSMYERYGIGDGKVREFEAKEAEFIQGVRNLSSHAPLFQAATPDYERIYRRMEEFSSLAMEEEKDSEKKPYRIGYVPGVFDLFHIGHLNLLERCKSRCEYLIVGVLTDELAEYYKGRRTVIRYEDRARVIAALSVVDEVIPVDFSNTDKLDAWERLHYDCHFSGDDHASHWNDVWEELKKRGSNMEFFPYTPEISSTQIREAMKTEERDEVG